MLEALDTGAALPETRCAGTLTPPLTLTLTHFPFPLTTDPDTNPNPNPNPKPTRATSSSSSPSTTRRLCSRYAALYALLEALARGTPHYMHY